MAASQPATRPGASNSPSASCPIPASSDPDRTDNYEAGLKGSLLDRRLNFELTGYHIKWKNVQLNVSVPYLDQTCIYVTNGGTTTSNGVEASTGFQLLPELSLSGTLTYQDAHLDEDICSFRGVRGRLQRGLTTALQVA